MNRNILRNTMIAAALLVMLPMLFWGFDRPVFDSYDDILKRIPNGDFYLVSVNVEEVMNSRMSDFVAEISGHKRDFRVLLNEEADEIPLNYENVERVTFFSDNIEHSDLNFDVILTGRNLDLDFERILEESYVTDNIVKIEGYDVHLVIHDRPRRHMNKAYIYFDDNEIIAADGKQMMTDLLALKKGRGENLGNNKKVTDKMKRLKNKNSSWFYFPTDQLAQDVMRKVYLRRPDFQGQQFELESILGEASFEDFFEFGFHAYNQEQDQLDILFDLMYGVRGMTMLSLMDYPEAREILAKIELEKKKGYIGVEGRFSEKDFETLKKLHIIRE